MSDYKAHRSIVLPKTLDQKIKKLAIEIGISEEKTIAALLAEVIRYQKKARYRILRQDEAGNIFVVKHGLSKEDAAQLCRSLEQNGHKQTYWIEEESNRTKTP